MDIVLELQNLAAKKCQIATKMVDVWVTINKNPGFTGVEIKGDQGDKACLQGGVGKPHV